MKATPDFSHEGYITLFPDEKPEGHGKALCCGAKRRIAGFEA
jgi:hypothetical protein